MSLSDREIIELCQGDDPMIFPFVDHLVREVNGRKVLSYGLSSRGYDLTLSPNVYVLSKKALNGKGTHQTILDPKASDLQNYDVLVIEEDASGQFVILPGLACGLGVAIEYLKIPPHILAKTLGKSSYARCHVGMYATPAEPGWEGNLVLEFMNTSRLPVRLYVNEGFAQMVFYPGAIPITTYAGRKYHKQRGLRLSEV